MAIDAIASWVGIATGGIALLTAALVLWNTMRTAQVSKKADEIHVLVNQRLDDTLAEVRRLHARVEELGGEKAP